jgi:hypothetical protein
MWALLSDFKIQGDFGTDIGNLTAELHYSQPPKANPEYQGSFRSKDINLKSCSTSENWAGPLSILQ